MIRITLGLVVVVSSAFVAGCNESPFDYDLYSDKPIVEVEIAFQPSSEDELRDVVGKFAELNAYSSRVARIHPVELDFSIMMWRGDSMILGGTPFEYDLYRFGIYAAKADPISEDAAKSLSAELQSSIGSK